MNRVEDLLRALVGGLAAARVRFALVGGLGVSVRTEPRFTRDVDLALAVSDDRDAEEIVQSLVSSGYAVTAVVEQQAKGRLATVRLRPPGGSPRGVIADLLFASSGIEEEIVAAADGLEVFPGVSVPVARVGHLIALKLLSRDDVQRPQDAADLAALLGVAEAEEIGLARGAIALIERRSYARGRNLGAALERWLARGSR